MNKTAVIPVTNTEASVEPTEGVVENVQRFADLTSPLEKELYLLTDARNGAYYCECHISANHLIELGTVDVALDPEEQPDYRANRELAEDHVAFARMCADAELGRTFSNIVCEFDDQDGLPIKIVGGQHRFRAIELALNSDVNEFHGIKIYFSLSTEQRLDVQLISNTNIEVSSDLLDRMYETQSGPQLREWCQKAGLLDEAQDFADKRRRGNALTVRAARTFIMNYYRGKEISPPEAGSTKTVPEIVKSGEQIPEWEAFKHKHPEIWSDKKLNRAGKEFARLMESQREYFRNKGGDARSNVDFAEKSINFAVLSAWAYVAGMLSSNKERLERHYALADRTSTDPLNAAALAKGRHKTDAENYRGLGYRTDAKERGRFVELFMLQAEKGDGIRANIVDLAIKKYHAKQAVLEVIEAQGRV